MLKIEVENEKICVNAIGKPEELLAELELATKDILKSIAKDFHISEDFLTFAFISNILSEPPRRVFEN